MNNLNLKYKDMLNEHKENVINDMLLITKELERIGYTHDNDKLEPEIFKIYELHYPKLKTFKYGTDEYIAYEKKYLSDVGKHHVQQRHHYNNKNHTNDTDINLFDIFEILVDMRSSQLQYQPDNYTPETIINNMNNGNLFDLTMEEVMLNTLKKLDELK